MAFRNDQGQRMGWNGYGTGTGWLAELPLPPLGGFACPHCLGRLRAKLGGIHVHI